jgi:hypothetical protein
MHPSRSLLPVVLVLSVLEAAVLPAQTRKPAATGWAVEDTSAQVVLRLRAATPVAYGYVDPVRPELVLACDRASQTVEAYIGVGVKPNTWVFAVRVDQEPVVEFTSKMRDGRSADALLQLPVPQAQARGFVASLAGRQALLLRFVRDHQREASFDLTGFDRAVGPFAAACGLEGELAAARTKAPVTASAATPRPAGRETKIGSWEVREKTSSLDDKPVVVLSTTARGDWSQLVLRCQEATPEAYVFSGSVVDSGNKDQMAVLVALDDEEPREVMAGVAAGSSAFFLPEAARLIPSLRGGKAFKVRFQRYRAKAPANASFDLTGLDRALEAFTKACPLG